MDEATKGLQPSSTMANLAESFLLWRRYRQQRLKSQHISLKQVFILRQLQNGDLNPSQIAELLFTDRASTTVMLQTMQRRQWIEKRRDTVNRKYVWISISEQGQRRLEAIEAFERRLPRAANPLACFSGEERAEFDRLIRKLRNRMGSLKNSNTQGEDR